MKLHSQMWILAVVAVFFWMPGCASDSGGSGDSGGETAETGESETGESETGETAETEETGETEDTGETGEVGCLTDEECISDGPVNECVIWACVDEECIAQNVEDDVSCEGIDLELEGTCGAPPTCQNGSCVSFGVKDCDDENSCTDDSCDLESGECESTPNDAACDDGSICTSDDVCSGGTCGGTTLTCNDDNPCTIDSCDEVEGCLNTANTLPCEDGNPCTVGDACVEGTCTSGANECAACEATEDCVDDGNLCNPDEACVDGYCQIVAGTGVICDTSEDSGCSTTACNPDTGGCEVSIAENGSACEDGDPCTADDLCEEGECITGSAIDGCFPGCVASPSPGCGGCDCEECVCDIDAFCCEFYWDASCATLCEADCEGTCSAPDPDAGCESLSGPGCGGCACEECVCAIDSFCCENSWDGICAGHCGNSCGGNCDTPTGGGQGDCDPGYIENCIGGCTIGSWIGDNICDTALDCEATDFDGGDCTPCYPDCDGKNCGDDGCGESCGSCGEGENCYDDGICAVHCGNDTCESDLGENCNTCIGDCGECQVSSGCDVLEQPSCGGCSCEACVCDADESCCDVAWDASCVLSCMLDCGGCDYDDGCFPYDEPGCTDCGCEACVCEADPFCCDTQWDSFCALGCQENCGENCNITTCTTDIDCFDGDACTIDTCAYDAELELGYCFPEPNTDLCCFEDADCDDGNECTLNACNEDGTCVATAAPVQGCCPDDGQVFSVNFESDIPFSIENSSSLTGWSISSAQSLSESHSIRFGNKNGGAVTLDAAEGTLTSSSFLVPPSFTLNLHYWVWASQEATPVVRIVTAGGAEDVISNQVAENGDTWEEVVFDLKPWSGQEIALEFFFSSTQGGTAQVFIDDISVASDCYFEVCGDGECKGDNEDCYLCPEDCEYPATCPENDGCSEWENPGCAECECQECVCEQDASCCDVAWDDDCVSLCSDCMPNTDCGPPPGCVPSNDPGCGGCECEAEVCAADSFCCSLGWDSLCISACENYLGIECPLVCKEGQMINCAGTGCTYESWLADNYCDSSLNCAEYNFDEGDCP